MAGRAAGTRARLQRRSTRRAGHLHARPVHRIRVPFMPSLRHRSCEAAGSRLGWYFVIGEVSVVEVEIAPCAGAAASAQPDDGGCRIQTRGPVSARRLVPWMRPLVVGQQSGHLGVATQFLTCVVESDPAQRSASQAAGCIATPGRLLAIWRPQNMSRTNTADEGRPYEPRAARRCRSNEAIEEGLWPSEDHETILIRCECGRQDCREVETVVQRKQSLILVEKTGQAGRDSERTDFRHPHRCFRD